MSCRPRRRPARPHGTHPSGGRAQFGRHLPPHLPDREEKAEVRHVVATRCVDLPIQHPTRAPGESHSQRSPASDIRAIRNTGTWARERPKADRPGTGAMVHSRPGTSNNLGGTVDTEIPRSARMADHSHPIGESLDTDDPLTWMWEGQAGKTEPKIPRAAQYPRSTHRTE